MGMFRAIEIASLVNHHDRTGKTRRRGTPSRRALILLLPDARVMV